MDIRHLRYFLAVADALNFGVAARLLHMSQPPLSKRIAEFEQQIGAPLFVRSTRRVELSAAGRELLPHARLAVQAFDAAMQTARAFGQSSRRLRIAFPPDTSHAVLSLTLSGMLKDGVAVDSTEATTAEQIALLAAAEIDVAVLRHPFDAHTLTCGARLRQTLGVLLPVAHPLEHEPVIHLAQLQPWPLIIFPRAVAPELHDHLLWLCRQGGYCPQRIIHGLRMTAGMLMAESAVAFFTQDGVGRLFDNLADLRWKPIAGEPLYWSTSVVARKDNTHAGVPAAIALITTLLKEYDHWLEAEPA